jgi:hypothetical protein
MVLALAALSSSTASAATAAVYDDSLRWDNWSWGTTVDTNATAHVHEGSRSMAVTYNQAWAGLQLHHNGFDTSPYSRLEFGLHPNGHPLPSITAKLYTGSSSLGSVAITDYEPDGPDADGWYAFKIPLADLNADGTTVTRIVLQDRSGGAQPTFYVDSLQFASADGAPPPPGAVFIYDETTHWDSWSWSTSIDRGDTDPVYSGSRSMRVTYTGAWAGLSFHDDGFDTSGLSTLRFAIHTGGNPFPNVRLKVYDAGGGQIGNVDPRNYDRDAGDGWRLVSVPLADLGAADTTITRVTLQENSGSPPPAFNIDDYGFFGATVILSADADTYIRHDLEIIENDNIGCERGMGVGTSRSPHGTGDGLRSLIRFDLSAIPEGAEIESATMELTIQVFLSGPSSSVFTIDAHRVLEPWIEGNGAIAPEPRPEGCVHSDPAYGVAWAAIDDNNQAQPAFDPAVAASTTVKQSEHGPGDVIHWDITALVQDWHDGTTANHGLLLRDLTAEVWRSINFGTREGPAWAALGWDDVVAVPRLVVTLSADVPDDEPITEFVYDDSAHWANWSWSTSIDPGDTDPVHDGSNSMRVTYNSAWAGLSFRHSGFDTSDFSTLRFAIHTGGSPFPNVRLKVYGAGGSVIGNVDPRNYDSDAGGGWRLVTVPLTHLNAADTTITRVTLQEASGSPPPAFNIDAFGFWGGGG